MKFKKLLLTVGFFALSATANATVIVGSGLQDKLDSMSLGGSFYDVNASQYNPDEMWELGSTDASINRLLFELAGFANVANFGIYDLNDISITLELFSGIDCGSATASCDSKDGFTTLSRASGNVFTAVRTNTESSAVSEGGFDIGGGTTVKAASETFSTSRFGYYLDSGDGTFYSEAAKNGGDDHMVAFRGNDVLKLDRNGDGNFNTFLQSEFIFAWEDLGGLGDRDYGDFVVLVESVESVPTPNVLAFMGLGLFGLAVSRRKKVKVKQ